MAALQAHSGYWTNPDVASFIVSQTLDDLARLDAMRAPVKAKEPTVMAEEPTAVADESTVVAEEKPLIAEGTLGEVSADAGDAEADARSAGERVETTEEVAAAAAAIG